MRAIDVLRDYVPITSTLGFLECEPIRAVETFVEWQQRIQTPRKVRVAQRAITGDIASQICSLQPLTSLEARRFLLSPVARRWTLFLDNAHTGTDAMGPVSYLCGVLGISGIRVTFDYDDRIKEDASRGGTLGTVFEYYDGVPKYGVVSRVRRSVFSTNESGRWEFDAHGDPLEFENVERLRAARTADRFRRGHMIEYLKHCGIDLESDDLFDGAEAFLVEKSGPCAKDMREFTLIEAQNLWK